MKNKMIAVSAILLIALMLAGVSYALWSKTLYIYGDVYTGDLDAKFGTWFDWEAYDEAGNVIPPEKETFEVYVYPDELDDQILWIEIYDFYPCITLHIWYEIWNDGTVPWVVNSYYWEPFPVDSTFPGTITLTPADLIGTQVDPGFYVQGDIEIHITNDAEEGGYYGFTVYIWVVQWNEYPVI